jgi:predicted transcriptional regulator
MSSTTIRVDERTRDRLSAISARQGRPMTAVVDDAVDALERRLFFEQYNGRYADLRADAEAWSDVEDERAAESGAISDESR